MDLVTQSLLASFRQEESLPDEIDEPTIFEHFVNFISVSSEYSDEFDVEDIHTGGGDDLGIDGIALLANGTLISDLAEIDDLATANKYLEIDIVCCQAKSGGSFSGSEISNFFFGVKDLFSSEPALPRNSKVAEKASLIKTVYKKSPLFKRGNPNLRMFYATTGKWQDDPKLTARIENEKETLCDLNIFGNIVFQALDARTLQRLYANAKNRLSRSIEFA